MFSILIDPFRNITLFKNISSKDYIFRMEEKLIKSIFFRFFRISGPSGSGKPGASILGKSLDQEEPNDTSSLRIGAANLSIHTLHYSYLLKIRS